MLSKFYSGPKTFSIRYLNLKIHQKMRYKKAFLKRRDSKKSWLDGTISRRNFWESKLSYIPVSIDKELSKFSKNGHGLSHRIKNIWGRNMIFLIRIVPFSDRQSYMNEMHLYCLLVWRWNFSYIGKSICNINYLESTELNFRKIKWFEIISKINFFIFW